MQKIFVLDTNILIQTAGQVIHGFDDNKVVVTHTTLEELDGLKNAAGETGYNARESIRIIASLKEKGDYLKGIQMDNGGEFLLVTNHLDAELPTGWSLDKPDNRIICTTKSLALQNPNTKVALITNDVAMQIKALAAGAIVQDYHNEQVQESDSYTGRTVICQEESFIDKLYELHTIPFSSEGIIENEFVIVKALYGNKSAICWYKKGCLHLIQQNEDFKVYGITPKNAAQRFALEALQAPADEIPLVILKGPAGCGKTLLAIASGLDKTYNDKKETVFDKVVITRSNSLSDEEMGFLPGDLRDKMTPLLSPFFDNLEVLIRHEQDEEREQIQLQIDDLIETGIVEICSLAYIRGRSIPKSMIIIDEAQNLTITQAKTIVTRAGMDTKVVFLGDPDQIDNPKLDKRNNGLVYLSEKFKGSPLCAQLEFNKDKECVRSPLAKEAINILMPDNKKQERK